MSFPTTLDIIANEKYDQGLSQGLSQGRMEGELTGMVRAYHNLGFSPEEIAARTGQPISTVTTILKQL